MVPTFTMYRLTGWRPAFPLRPRHGYAAGIHRGLLDEGSHPFQESTSTLCRRSAAPLSGPYPPGWSWRTLLRGFHHWFLHSYTVPSCLPDPSRLAVPTRSVVVRAAPTFPSASWVRLPSASSACCDRSKVEPSDLHSVSWRLVAHQHVRASVARAGVASIDGRAFTRRFWRHSTMGGKTFPSDWRTGSTWDLVHEDVGLVERPGRSSWKPTPHTASRTRGIPSRRNGRRSPASTRRPQPPGGRSLVRRWRTTSRRGVPVSSG